MEKAIGHKCWAIPEGFIPEESTGPEPEMTSHESISILNTSDKEANIEITIFYTDRDPVGPYKEKVPARRTKHIRFNNLKDPEPIPRNKEYASVITSDIPVVIQHTRLDSRQAENALISTMAYSAE
ncbi:MAG: sensory rhodopsin transducer [Cytophagaceae bacterium]